VPVNANASQEATGLRARRLEAGLSQEKLARLADCSTSTIRLIEGGWRPSEQMAGRIAGALDCPIGEIR
jgi:transcriptional regulator with XRE-family HTH domain